MRDVGAEIRGRAAILAITETSLTGAAEGVGDLDDAADIEWVMVEEAGAEIEAPVAGILVIAGVRVCVDGRCMLCGKKWEEGEEVEGRMHGGDVQGV